MKTIYIFTNIAPHYRKFLWKKILENTEFNFHFFFGKHSIHDIQEIDIKNNDFMQHQEKLHCLTNLYIKNKLNIWQKGVIRNCFSKKLEVAIFLGDVHLISTWLAALICRIRGIEVIFWSHGFYGNEGKLKLLFRRTFYKLADKHLLYERRAKQLMIRQGFRPDNLYVIFNSLDYLEHYKMRNQFQSINKSELFSFLRNPFLRTLIFIGRLTPFKKLHLLIQAVNKINLTKPVVNLILIGEGSERNKLEKLGEKGLIEKWLYFKGACYKEQEIGFYLSFADLCVSPGNVGLTAIHSLSYGTPICTHNNLNNQMPESQAIINGFNGFYFEENNVDDMVNKIKDWFTNAQDRESIRRSCYQIIDKYYNPYYQLSVINRLLKKQKPEL